MRGSFICSRKRGLHGLLKVLDSPWLATWLGCKQPPPADSILFSICTQLLESISQHSPSLVADTMTDEEISLTFTFIQGFLLVIPVDETWKFDKSAMKVL